MSRDEKVREITDEFNQKIEKLCKEYGVSRARATILKPKIDEGKLKNIIADGMYGVIYSELKIQEKRYVNETAHAIAQKAEEWIK